MTNVLEAVKREIVYYFLKVIGEGPLNTSVYFRCEILDSALIWVNFAFTIGLKIT